MLRIRPTRRGLALGAVVLGAVAMSVTFGPRSLDAIIMPAGVVLLAAGVQLYALEMPRVDRTTPPDGDPGTTGTVTLDFTTDTPATARVHDRLPAGVDGESRLTTLVGGDPCSYEVTYRERGDHALGPTVVSARDVFGVAERTVVCDGPDDALLVYPRVYHPSAPLTERLQALATPYDRAERGEFAHLREYTQSDSLRDIHWKSSAKQDDLVVQEFTDDDDRRTVTVAATADVGRADRMAEATASVGCALLDEGVHVSLTTPDGGLVATPGDADRLLAHLARVGAGRVGTRDADIVITATDGGVTVDVGGETVAFDPGERRRVEGGSMGDGAPARPVRGVPA